MPKGFLAKCFNLSKTVINGLGNEQEDTTTVWIPLIPAGEAKGRDGRTWYNTNPDGIVEAFNAKLPFDLEHATEIKAPEGEAAPAYGWILALENRDGEIWGEVEWTLEGRWKIQDKSYLYYSPAFMHDSEGVIIAMSSAGLTNKPNFYVPALNREEEVHIMPLSEVMRAALGLGETATEQDAVTAINTLKRDKEIALNRAEQPDLNKFVGKETYDLALNRAETAEAELAEIKDKELDDLVQAQVEAGKIAPADKEMFVGLCRQEGGVEQFNAFVGKQNPIADGKPKTTPTTTPEGELSEDQLALCRAMNASPEEWKANLHHKPNYSA